MTGTLNWNRIVGGHAVCPPTSSGDERDEWFDLDGNDSGSSTLSREAVSSMAGGQPLAASCFLERTGDAWKWLRRHARLGIHLLLAGFVGILLAIPGQNWTVYFAGGGHGTLAPLFVLFGPVMLVYYMWPGLHGRDSVELFLVFAAMNCLYGAYAIAIAWGRRCRVGIRVLLGVLLVHYLAVSVLMSMRPGEARFEAFVDILGASPFVHSYGFMVYFFLLHVAAVAVAVSSKPISRRDVLATAVSVAAATVFSLIFVACAIATCPR